MQLRTVPMPVKMSLAFVLVLLCSSYVIGQADEVASGGAEDVAVAAGQGAGKANPKAAAKKDKIHRGKAGFDAMAKLDKNRLDVIAQKHGKSTAALQKEMEQDQDLAIDPDHDTLMFICEGLAVDGVAGGLGVVTSSIEGEGASTNSEGSSLEDVMPAAVGTASAFVDSSVSTDPQYVLAAIA